MKEHIGKIFAGLAIILVGASFVYANFVSNQANEGIVFTENVKGNPDAVVSLVKYSDFQCGACAQFYPSVNAILADYGDQIRFEYKHFPLVSIHQNAIPAAKAAEAAGQQGEFFAMHDLIFENQSVWANSANPISFFNQYAQEIGLDVEEFKTQYRASLIEDRIQESFNEARELGLSGTPTFFLNGEQMEIESFQDFRSQIETALGVIGDEAGQVADDKEAEISIWA